MKTIIVTLAVILSLTSTQSLAHPESRTRANVNEVLEDISVGPAPSREGLASQNRLNDDQELMNQKETTVNQIKQALEDGKKLAVGARFEFYTNAARTIIQDSGNRPTEAAARIALNRAVDVVNGTILASGHNEELIASWISNLLEKSFELAAAYANNPACVITSRKLGAPEECLRSLPVAKVGYDIDQLLWRSHASPISNTAKAVLMIKILQYFKIDLSNDPRRTEDGFASVYKKVVRVTESYNYQKVVASLTAEQEPETSDLAALSVAVDNIYTAMPAILSK